MSVEHGARDKWMMTSVRELKAFVQAADIEGKVPAFNDVITGKDAPVDPPEPHRGGYSEGPVLADVMVDGRLCDVYHTDFKQEDSSGNRIYIHIKE